MFRFGPFEESGTILCNREKWIVSVKENDKFFLVTTILPKNQTIFSIEKLQGGAYRIGPFKRVWRYKISEEGNSWIAVVEDERNKKLLLTSWEEEPQPLENYGSVLRIEILSRGNAWILIEERKKGEFYLRDNEGSEYGPFLMPIGFLSIGPIDWLLIIPEGSIYKQSVLISERISASIEKAAPIRIGPFEELIGIDVAIKGDSWLIGGAKKWNYYIISKEETFGPYRYLKDLSISPSGNYFYGVIEEENKDFLILNGMDKFGPYDEVINLLMLDHEFVFVTKNEANQYYLAVADDWIGPMELIDNLQSYFDYSDWIARYRSGGKDYIITGEDEEPMGPFSNVKKVIVSEKEDYFIIIDSKQNEFYIFDTVSEMGPFKSINSVKVAAEAGTGIYPIFAAEVAKNNETFILIGSDVEEIYLGPFEEIVDLCALKNEVLFITKESGKVFLNLVFPNENAILSEDESFLALD